MRASRALPSRHRALIAGMGLRAAARRERPSEVAVLLGITQGGVVLVGVGGVLVVICGFWLIEVTGRVSTRVGSAGRSGSSS
jgi:hypothetical protein